MVEEVEIMRFSVIVPVYNIEKYVAECIESVLAQDYNDYEVILVDDGSSDRSPQICDRYEEHNKKISVVHKANGGLVSARLAGVELAKGDYIVCLDGDDLLKNDMFRRISEVVDKCSPDIICFDSQHLVNNKVEPKVYSKHVNEGIYESAEIELIKNNCICDFRTKTLNGGALKYTIWSKVVKRELYKECQCKIPESITLGEDLAVTLNLLESCKSIYVLHYSGYIYRQIQSSMTKKPSITQIEKIFTATDYFIEFSKSNVCYENQIAAYLSLQLSIYVWQLAKSYSEKNVFATDMKKVMDRKYDAMLKCGENMEQSFRRKMKIRLIRKNDWGLIYMLSRHI